MLDQMTFYLCLLVQLLESYLSLPRLTHLHLPRLLVPQPKRQQILEALQREVVLLLPRVLEQVLERVPLPG